MRTPCCHFTPTLTPALSLREEENRSQSPAITCGSGKLGGHGVTEHEHMLFALPAGKGQGEGERHAQKGAPEFL